MLLTAPALTLAWPAGVISLRIRRGIVALLIGSALHDIECWCSAVPATHPSGPASRNLSRRFRRGLGSGFLFKRAFSSPRLAAHYYGLCW